MENIIQPIKEELKKFENFYRDCLSGDSPLLNKVLKYIYERQGKRIRPICVFLSASATLKPIKETTYVGASAVEMIHTASIIHDDVVDRSELRRGDKSVNAEWSAQIAVLVGDFLLAKSLMLATKYNMFEFMEIMSRPICEMSEGEIIQIEKTIDLDITEEIYFEIIKKKTAALIAASMKIGTKSTGADEFAETMYNIGENIGMAFQIKDDIFDYEKTNLLGKPTGNDVVERKITLPLIYALKQVDTKEKKSILKCVKEASINKKNIAVIRDFVITHNGSEYAMSVAENYVEKAISLINTLPDSQAKQSLINLAHYVVKRNI